MIPFAFIFPGQGSQLVGMLTELAEENMQIEATFREASEVLDFDLWKLVQDGPNEKLNKTWNTQPALLASSVAIYRVWQSKGGRQPYIMAGHSLGEYSALVCSGVLDFIDAIKLVELRGKLMQEAVPEGQGAMYAVLGLEDKYLQKICKDSSYNQVVSLVSFNSPGQAVIAGHKEAVKRAILACEKAHAKLIIPLSITVPSHCSLMKPAAKKLAIALKFITFNTPIVPVINNVDVKCEKKAKAIRYALERQLYSPVRWTETVRFMAMLGIKELFEIGPGKVLTNFTKRITNSLSATTVNDPVSLKKALLKTIREKL
ncbi:ACP S-malonyltransferase [Pantoea sp. Aalb]|uniref:ACP S-malonyltransferase n=1 Tax=Pantoea sp. Aalb TaxID=2576762 RepID=UPI001325F31B|nr:ACP S-malonyltransferase [Pantoea sp. Aalb]MXP67465.1 ACP S-malonyltransferase [Pantoea sp. Aalb]